MNPNNIDDRIALTRAVMAMLDDWGLASTEIIQLLGLPSKTRLRQLEHFRHNKPFPDNEQIMMRIEHLVGIADALRTSYPRNARMGTIWLRRPHRRLSYRTPLATMIEGGVKGLRSVRAELDCAYSWERSASSS
jgi:hypothetical protein